MRHEELLVVAEDVLRENSIDLPLGSTVDFIIKVAKTGAFDQGELESLAGTITAALEATVSQPEIPIHGK